jgi:hypothetical protein
MASMGLKYMAWAPIAEESASAVPTYGAGLVVGKMVSTNLSISNAEGELHADDMLAEYISEFSSAELTAEVDNISLENQAKFYGASYENNEFGAGVDDIPPLGGIGGIQVLLVNNARKFRAWFFPKARASMPDWDAATKGGSISFGTQPIKMKVLAPRFGKWYHMKEFDTEAAAKAYIDTKLGVATWYTVEVQVQGDGVGKTVSPVGMTAVASGEDMEIAIAGAVTALYDNGVESKEDVSGGKYTITDIAANHKIAVIF